MYGDYGNRHIPDYDENHSRTNGFPPEKSPFQRSQSISNRPTAKTIYQQRKAYAQALNSTDSLIQYRVEHLFTCDLNSKDMKTVDHCIKKLKLLDAKGKIWGQDMILQLTGTTFKMADIETKDDLELFPIDAIQDSQAIENSCIYNSVLAVTIRDRTKNKSSVYLFQCEDVSADLIQNDIDNMIRGKKEVQGNQDILRSNLESMLSQHPRPPYGKSSTPPAQERWIPPDYDKPQHPAMSEHGSWTDRQSRTSSEYGSKFSNDDIEKTIPSFLIVQRNTDILNHILEDIELFNNKIIQAVGSNTEKALKKKKKSKKHKEALPPEEEYKECLQKLKYAFNLISKLEAELQAPSALDLVNVLFQILGFILRSIPNPDLAPNVIIPFLIPGAIQFLNSNTSAEQRDIWRSLGDAWNTPRSDWPNGESFQSFVPTFTSGWEPPTLQSLRFPRPNLSDDSTRPKQQMGSSYAAPFERSQNNPKWAKAMYDFVKRNTRELTVTKGDNLEVLEATRQWWKVKDQNGYVGYVPSNIMQLMNLEESLPSHIDDYHSFQYPSYADSPHLTVHSTPSEVATWLEKKGFSKVTVKSLRVLTGSQLLSLTKEELKMVSVMEGHIVYDEIHSGH
ncbi:epidermal growth factor receptor kinase substrate 8-like protein 3b [Heterodontus francisci]|uniref:epidermal growth factor receptor kinase substrate 8-like protein 3b n=1 Tax=Heterodontus francisci TaxID=7792 RepID=UPI00355AF84E